jgi:hypothetical protein
VTNGFLARKKKALFICILLDSHFAHLVSILWVKSSNHLVASLFALMERANE